MKRIIGKLMGALLVVGMGMTTVYGNILYQSQLTQTITKGVTHTHEKLLMQDGWKNVNLLKIDLEEPNILLAPLEPSTGIGRENVVQMAQNQGAVAGINADFFDMKTTHTPSLGMLINEGHLRYGYNSNHSTLGINKNMATFLLDSQNEASLDYYGLSMQLYSKGQCIESMASKNNVPSSITRPIIIDTTYKNTTESLVKAHRTVYTIVVEDGKVAYLSHQGEVVTIPKNGFVIIVPEAAANRLYKQLQLGDDIELKESIYLKNGIVEAVNQLKLGIGGSGLIMKDGEAYTGAAHSVTPKNKVARTVIGTIKGTKEVLLMTVDSGNGYIGASQSDLVQLLKRYQVEDAMYLDGGGSTTLAVRHQGESKVQLQNTPSYGTTRKVANGLGVFTIAEPGPLAQLCFKEEEQRTFVGQPIHLSLKGLDEYSNPVPIEDAKVTYTIEGITGNFKGNTFTPTSSGTGTLTAQVQNISVHCLIKVSAQPTALLIEPSYLQINKGETKKVDIYGVDTNGYKILLEPTAVTWTTDYAPITAKGNSVTATSTSGIARLTASYGGAKGVMGAIIGPKVQPLESFEQNKARWGQDTKTVKGTVFPVKDIKYEGSQSVKMTYTFKPSKEKQVASMILEQPVKIPSDASSINLWVYSRNQEHGARIQLTDAAGKVITLNLIDSLQFNGWKYISVPLPEELKLPAQLTKLNVYTNEVVQEVTSAIYIDHLSITRGFREGQGILVRADHLADSAYKPSLQSPINGQSIINVVGPTKVSNGLLEEQELKRLTKQLSSDAKLIIEASSQNYPLPNSTQVLTYQNQYQVGTYGKTQVLMLGTAKGGIRATEASSWIKLQADIDQSLNTKNLIIITANNPLTQFKDPLEGQAFHEYLRELREKTDKNIFVVYAGGTEPEVMLEDGIRYIRTNGLLTVTNQYEEGSFVKFKIDGDKVYYTLELFK